MENNLVSISKTQSDKQKDISVSSIPSTTTQPSISPYVSSAKPRRLKHISRDYIRRWYGIKTTREIAAHFGCQVQTIYGIVNQELETRTRRVRL